MDKETNVIFANFRNKGSATNQARIPSMHISHNQRGSSLVNRPHGVLKCVSHPRWMNGCQVKN